jgi:hypothetical protein
VSIGDKLRDGAAEYLQPGEQFQAAFLAKRPKMPYNDCAVVATDCRLLLLKLNFFGRPTALLGTSERRVRLGPCRGFMYRLPAFDSRLAVNKRFFSDVADTDRAAGF